MDSQAPVTLADVIGWIESRGNMQALRFEPGVYDGQKDARVIAHIRALHLCSRPTAEVIYSTSFGKFQIMGFNLYAQAGKLTIAEYLLNADAQHESFTDFLSAKKLDVFTPQSLLDRTNALTFARLYNGSSLYASSIGDALSHFGVTAS